MDVSILIPARNERFLKNTIDDLLAHCESDFEIIAVLDGAWAEPPIPQHERVTLIHHPESIGQRAAINEAARISSGKWLIKCDAHCAFDQGFDVKLLADMQPDWTVVPVMRNLHVFDWVCKNGHRRYQGPSGPCKECGESTTMDVVWIAKTNPQSTSYCFDSEPHFQYFNAYKSRPECKGDGPNQGLTESMSLQGSFFMLSREKYFELNVCDEEFGSWGSQGIEVACKTWLSGGRVIVSHKTWYGHCFRTQGGDFGFPYPVSGRQTEHAKHYAKDLFFNDKWEKAVKPLSWLVERFWPVPGWTQEDLNSLKTRDFTRGVSNHIGYVGPSKSDLSKGILYYTDNRLDESIASAVRTQIKNSVNSHAIVSVSLAPLDFGKNIVLDAERGYLTMFRQILTGLEALDTDIVYFCEHDVLYHPSHFDFVPLEHRKYYYNENVWHVRASDGHALYYTAKRLSQLCAYRELLVKHYKKRVANTEAAFERFGDDTREYRKFIRQQGFEPGSHGRAERVDDFKAESWKSEHPNLDIKHGGNLTGARWRQDQFRDQRNCQNWQEAEAVAGWYTPGKFEKLLKEI